MKIFVKAKPGAREEKVVKVDDINYVVSVKERPVEGRANFAIGLALAKYFNVPNYEVKLISGTSSRQKIFEIP
jgi:uncharacterized protein YggU (UPF0235/DUF167 family)